MVKWKWLKWGSLFSILFVGLQLGMVLNVQARGTNNPFDDSSFTNVMTDKYYKKALAGKELLDGPKLDLANFPVIDKLVAKPANQGRITAATTEICVRLKTPTGRWSGIPGNLKSAKIVLLTNNKNLSIIAADKPSVMGNAVLFDRTNGFIFKDLNLSGLNKLLPLYIGFQIETQKKGYPAQLSTYYLGTLTNDGDQINDEDQNKLRILDGLTPTSTTISGTGTPGYTINSDAGDEAVEVKKDGTYTLPLKEGELANHLLQPTDSKIPQITITEYNQFGELVAKKSQRQLKMSKAENNPAFHIEDSLSYPKDATDAAVLDDLRKRLEIKVDDDQLKDVRYGSLVSNLAQMINSQGWGTTISIPIHAVSRGYIQSNDVVVKITKRQENVIFTNQKSNLIFPKQALPLKPAEIWADDVWKLSVIDSRTIDKRPWTLTAIATKSNNDSNDQDLSDYLWYADAQHAKAVPLKNSVTILDSNMTPTSDANNSKEYDREFNNQKGSGIFIKTDPQMATGHYEATITWTLKMEATS